MSEVRSSQPDRQPVGFHTAKSNLESKLTTLLASLDGPTRTALEALVKAAPEERQAVLDAVDSDTRAALELVLMHMAK